MLGNSGQSNSWSMSRLILMVVTSIVMVLLLRNAFTKDYNMETKSYLTHIGREDAIAKVVPKTRAEYLKEVSDRKNTFDQLVQNVTNLSNDVEYLKGEVQRLRGSGVS